jgi:diguanylate cyclase (GGDEF)-like protein
MPSWLAAALQIARSRAWIPACLACSACLVGTPAWANHIESIREAGVPLAPVKVDQRLLDLEQLAVHQPALAQRKLDALVQGETAPDERTQLHVEVVRLLIADAQNRADDVLAICERIDARLRTLGDPRLSMLMNRTRSGAYYILGHLDEDWDALEEELRQAKLTGDDDLVAQAMVDRAGTLMKRNDFEPAAAAIADAERRVHGGQETAEVAFSNAILARYIGDWIQTYNAAQLALEKFTAVDDHTGQADSLFVAGQALQELGRGNEAIQPLTQAGKIYQEVGDKVGEARALRILGLVHVSLDEPAIALDLNARAIAMLLPLHQPYILADARIDRAALLVSRGRANEALALIELARPVLQQEEDLSRRSHFHETAAAALAALGQFKAAYGEMLRFYENDHLRTEQLVAHQLAAQRGRLESQRLSRENSLLRAQTTSGELALEEANRASRLQGIALALGGVVVLVVSFALWRQRALLQHIARMAETDSLTGMLNRRHVLELGQRMVQRCRRDDKPCAMLMLDVDHFKEINDKYGHIAGDRALRAIASALHACLRPGDQIGRYGGEEFAVILPGADAREAGVIAERLRTAVETLPADWAQGAPRLTVSGGIAIATNEIDDFTQLLSHADRALYRAKDAGRNRMEYHSDPQEALAAV